MRQVGILCAAALVALQENVEKLESDHKKAKLLAGKCYSTLTVLIFSKIYNFTHPLNFFVMHLLSFFKRIFFCLRWIE